MRYGVLLGIVLLGMIPESSSANGFGLFRRPAEVRPSYYVAPVVICPPGTPGYVAPVPRFQPAAFPPVPVAPVAPVAPYAIPFAAPPSSQEPPLSPRPMMGEASTSQRPADKFYSVLAGPVGMPRDDGRCSVAFWNLTGRQLSMRVENRDYVLPVGRNVTVDLPRSFTWQVAGRDVETGRLNDASSTAEVLIRR